jgi:type III pantothenate kinase
MSKRKMNIKGSGGKVLLLDIGNTNTHLGMADGERIVRQGNIPTTAWFQEKGGKLVRDFVGSHRVKGAALCSVVPRTTNFALAAIEERWQLRCVVLAPKTLRGIGVDYPRPGSIGPDRLANAVAVKYRFGAPAVVVDFGTAVTFDVVNRAGNYVGGIIAPGLAAMTEYLHEKTALLPRIRIRETRSAIGKSTEEAMLVGAVRGYRGLVRELVFELKSELKARNLPVIATGGYGGLIAAKLPEITAVEPLLTLEGLNLVWLAHHERLQI